VQLRVAESVAAELRRQILSNGRDESFRLPTQDQLVQDFGVSHPSIREAIRILETEGLVTVRRGKVGGAEVHMPDEFSAAYHLGLALQAGGVSIADLAACLLTLEPMCAASCARREDRATEVVPHLRASIARSTSALGDGPSFTRSAREFHTLVVSLSNNATMRYVVTSLVALWSAQELAWAHLVAGRGEYPSLADARRVVKAHEAVLDAIDDGDPVRAERLARAHLGATQEIVRGPLGDGLVNATSAESREAFAAATNIIL
jgi:GntR family transcriptional regulator, transcriptional repressor for pyruvate dehydrogenase complex